MTAYPLLEALLLPAFVVAAALAYPRLARAVAARLAPGELEVDARTFVATSAGGLAIVGWLGLGALGPALVTERGWTGALFACAAALLFVGRAHAVGRSLAWAPRGGGWLAGLVLGLGLLLVVVGARRVVAVEPGAAATTSMARARWALRFDPWDGEAYLAAAWGLRAEDRERARGMLALAERADASATGRALLEAELAALDGDCDAARAAFERALRTHAEAAFASGARLELGGVPVPEGLALHCDLGSAGEAPR